jgi:hypothetical protein
MQARYISISMDEVTCIDGSHLLGMHAYWMDEDWVRQCALVGLGRMGKDGTASALLAMTSKLLLEKGEVDDVTLSRKLMCMGTDGAGAFQGCNAGAIVKMKQQIAPFVLPMHCIAHRTQLAAGILSEVPFIKRIEGLVGGIATYFRSSGKRVEELKEFALDEEMDAPLTVTTYVKTRWLSLLPPLERLNQQYPVMAGKIHLDAEDNVVAALGLQASLLDLHVILSAAIVMPMLRELNYVIKATQVAGVYVKHLSDAIDDCLQALNSDYIRLGPAFDLAKFPEWDKLINGKDTMIEFDWDELAGEEVAVLVIGKEMRLPLHVTPRTGRVGRPGLRIVTRELYADAIVYVKELAKAAAVSLREAIMFRFPPLPILQAMEMIYPEWWVGIGTGRTRDDVQELLVAIKETYCKDEVVVKDDEESVVPALLDANSLDLELEYFFGKMRSQSKDAIQNAKSMGVNATTLLWQNLTSSPSIVAHMPEFIKLAEITLVLIGGSVEDERTFSIVKWVKNPQRNRLQGDNLDACVRVHGQTWFDLKTFPYEMALESWLAKTERRGVTTIAK